MQTKYKKRRVCMNVYIKNHRQKGTCNGLLLIFYDFSSKKKNILSYWISAAFPWSDKFMFFLLYISVAWVDTRDIIIDIIIPKHIIYLLNSLNIYVFAHDLSFYLWSWAIFIVSLSLFIIWFVMSCNKE